MDIRRLVCAAAVLAALFCATGAVSQALNVAEQDEGRGKKMDKMLKDVYTAFMMTKNLMSMALMFVTPIIQIKGFGLSVINTLVNIARFLMQIQTSKRIDDHMQVQRVSHNPHHGHVVVVKDQSAWPSEHHEHAWAVRPDNLQAWQSDPGQTWRTEHNPDGGERQQWDSSQKTSYYAPPPVAQGSGGSDQNNYQTPQHNLPPARASYLTGDYDRRLYPYFTQNSTSFRFR